MVTIIGTKRQNESAAEIERLANQINKFDTLSDLDGWIDANVTTLAQAREALKIMGRLLWSHEKRIRNLEGGG